MLEFFERSYQVSDLRRHARALGIWDLVKVQATDFVRSGNTWHTRTCRKHSVVSYQRAHWSNLTHTLCGCTVESLHFSTYTRTYAQRFEFKLVQMMVLSAAMEVFLAEYQAAPSPKIWRHLWEMSQGGYAFQATSVVLNGSSSAPRWTTHQEDSFAEYAAHFQRMVLDPTGDILRQAVTSRQRSSARTSYLRHHWRRNTLRDETLLLVGHAHDARSSDDDKLADVLSVHQLHRDRSRNVVFYRLPRWLYEDMLRSQNTPGSTLQGILWEEAPLETTATLWDPTDPTGPFSDLRAAVVAAQRV